jgi:hypothetical protein
VANDAEHGRSVPETETTWMEGVEGVLRPGDFLRSRENGKRVGRVVKATQYMDLALVEFRPLTRWERFWHGG